MASFKERFKQRAKSSQKDAEQWMADSQEEVKKAQDAKAAAEAAQAAAEAEAKAAEAKAAAERVASAARQLVVSASEPGRFAEQVLEATRSGDRTGELALLAALDLRVDAAVSAAGAEDLESPGPGRTAFLEWIDFLGSAIIKVTELDQGMQHFVWRAPGEEDCGAALVRRLWGACGSVEFDRVQVIRPPGGAPPKGVVLFTGKGGGSFADMAVHREWWQARGYAIVQAVKVSSLVLRRRQVERVLESLLDLGVAEFGLVGHIFSENGTHLWGNIMQRWREDPPEGLPPLASVLRGCVYDSCSSHGNAAEIPGGDWEPAQTAKRHRPTPEIDYHCRKQAEGFGMHTALKSIMNLVKVLSPEGEEGDDRMLVLDPKGVVAKALVESYAHNARFLCDDPVFEDFSLTWHKGALEEPQVLPRICFYSAVDPTVPAPGVERSAAWYDLVRGSPIEMVRFEKTAHCKHHLEEPEIYYDRLEKWLEKLPPGPPAAA